MSTKVRCPHCGEENYATDPRCLGCGAPQQRPARPDAPPPPAVVPPPDVPPVPVSEASPEPAVDAPDRGWYRASAPFLAMIAVALAATALAVALWASRLRSHPGAEKTAVAAKPHDSAADAAENGAAEGQTGAEAGNAESTPAEEQTSAESEQQTATQADPSAPPSPERLAEWCADAYLLEDSFKSGDSQLNFWVPTRVAHLNCSLPLKFALCQFGMHAVLLRQGQPGWVRWINETTASGIGACAEVTNKMLADDQTRTDGGAYGSLAVIACAVLGDRGSKTGDLRASADEDELKWLRAIGAEDAAIIVRQAQTLASRLAAQDFQAARAGLTQSCLRVLQKESESSNRQGVESAWQSLPDIVTARARLCRLLTKAERGGQN